MSTSTETMEMPTATQTEEDKCVYCGDEAVCLCCECADGGDGGAMCGDCAEDHGRRRNSGEWLCGGCAEEEESEEEVFDRKYPKASCHRCTTPVTGATVVLCGGAGGACETWYCGDCHEDGTADCLVCK
jgi:hypothetical protein